MLILLILVLVPTLWLISAWVLMLGAGLIHSEILPAVIPFGLDTGLKLSLFPLAASLFVFGTGKANN